MYCAGCSAHGTNQHDPGCPCDGSPRQKIREAIDYALEMGELSEDWAASLYANLDEPPKEDEEGWEILNGQA